MEESILMWNRLEGTLRNENQLDNALRFEIRDALWMLTRQWQFGELDGEDAGTAAFARIYGQQSPVIGIGAQTLPAQKFDFNQSPLEFPIERETYLPDIADRLEMGRHWERLLRKRLPEAQSKIAIQQFRAIGGFQFSTKLPKDPDRAGRFKNAQRYSDQSWLMLIDAIAGGRALDGYALILELKAGKAASFFLSQPDEVVNAAGVEYVQWFNRIFSQNAKNTWHAQHLEYQPQIVFNDSDGKPQVLRKEEYYGDGMEWHGFAPKPAWDGQKPPVLPATLPVKSSTTVIPSGVRFRGMPAARLWEMEDAQVDFGSIRAASTELNKMLFAEFGLVYSNDWLVAPFQFPCGSMCTISRLVVTDIFGKESVLEEIEPDNNWAFFQTIPSQNGKRWLFLSSGADFIQESKPVEKVYFLRDEMANMVWGVEEMLSNPYGGGRDGESLAKQTSQLVQSLNPVKTSTEGIPSSEGWAYKAGTLMAENRIPFIPIAVESNQLPTLGRRKVVLQRAATPRVSDEFPPIRIRPRTGLLGFTGKAESEKLPPFLIFEEEIPRTGIELNLVWKRARWFNGKTITWLSRQKTVGRGEIDANFRFDQLKNKKE